MLPRAALEELARKYRTMLAFRGGLPSAEAHQPLSAEQRSELRRYAKEFPGSLRELERLPTEAIEHRLAALQRTLDGGAEERWMPWAHGYHALMRAALHLRRRRGQQSSPTDSTELCANPEVLAAGEAVGRPLGPEFVTLVFAPPHGRLMAAIFAELGTLFGESSKTIWDALFPTAPGGGREYRRG